MCVQCKIGIGSMCNRNDPRGEEISTNMPNDVLVFNNVDVGELFDLSHSSLVVKAVTRNSYL